MTEIRGGPSRSGLHEGQWSYGEGLGLGRQFLNGKRQFPVARNFGLTKPVAYSFGSWKELHDAASPVGGVSAASETNAAAARAT